jgi:hypothetical protein
MVLLDFTPFLFYYSNNKGNTFTTGGIFIYLMEEKLQNKIRNIPACLLKLSESRIYYHCTNTKVRELLCFDCCSGSEALNILQGT